MNSEKNGSSRRHYLLDPFNEPPVDDSLDIREINTPIKDNSWTDAWTKTKWTVKALMNMCKNCNRDYTFCTAFEHVQEVVILLAEKGFTVLELECQQGFHPSTQQSYVPSISWQYVCVHCPEQHLDNKEECLQKMIERALQTLRQIQVRITELLCLHNTIQNAYFTE